MKNRPFKHEYEKIEIGITNLESKLNDFNHFNKNPTRVAELRKYCATSITHTTKTLSGGISSRLLKSESISGGHSKRKTAAKHYQSTSNLEEENSLITIAENIDAINCFVDQVPVAGLSTEIKKKESGNRL